MTTALDSMLVTVMTSTMSASEVPSERVPAMGALAPQESGRRSIGLLKRLLLTVYHFLQDSSLFLLYPIASVRNLFPALYRTLVHL